MTHPMSEPLRSWAQNNEDIDGHYLEHGVDCNKAADELDRLYDKLLGWGYAEDDHRQLEIARKEIDTLKAENERLASVRDRLHHELTELIALFGTNELRKYHAYAGCIEALAMSVESGSDEPITLAHAPDVDSYRTALKGSSK